jgi:thioredoxin-like negative regulator of GroEL
MSSPNLQFLRSQDFYLDEGTKGKVMCNNTKGFCLVLFHADSSRCTHCEECIPEFKKLPYKMGGVKFALVNVNRERDVVQMSGVTISPITYVPYIVLYINGRPTFRYDGERTTEKMLEFLNDVISSLQIVNRRDDPFVESLLNWCMGVGEDLSDKPGFTL